MVAADREFEGVIDYAEAANLADRGIATGHSKIAGFAVVLRNVAERHISGEELSRLLTTDQLTGAANRGSFFELAKVEINRRKRDGRPLSALMLDIDHFKHVNDCYGHAGGDTVLRRFAAVCRAQLRGRDVLARMGGEEFAVLLPDTGMPEAVRIAERIRSAIAKDVLLPSDGCLGGAAQPSLTVGVSIGCAMFTDAMSGIDALLGAADAALYEAKRDGRDRVRAAPQGFPHSGLS
jgi:diguanylate cyclase (GGDEF)-like protein